MRYKPSASEIETVREYADSDRVQYFVQRIIESEEVWGLGDESGWITRNVNGRTCLPVWPYEAFASKCIKGEWQEQELQEMSLEHFMYKVLTILKREDMDVEVFPTAEKKGQIIPAYQLSDFLESLMDAGEYYMEG